MRILIFISCLLVYATASSQFAPQVGKPGCMAIHKDQNAFQAWARTCTLSRGDMNIANPSLGKPTVGDATSATGKAGTNGVVSLGDGGTATLTFESPIRNGEGPDFAVFENGFHYAVDSSLAYLELAFVEVSSDGINFFRFAPTSNTDTLVQVGPYNVLDAAVLNNLAGKYVWPYGTPFDLEELKSEPGLDVDHITHVRIRDVTGSILPQYASRDAQGHIINDPWPTDFPNGGFDLDAVGVIYRQLPSGTDALVNNTFHLYPNPAHSGDQISVELPALYRVATLSVFTMAGQLLKEMRVEQEQVQLPLQLPAGCYVLQLENNGAVEHHKLMVN